jgi:hypothetical protein
VEIPVREPRRRMLPPVMVTERENYAIRSYAAAHGLTMSDLVRSALTAYLRGVRRPAHPRQEA